MAQSSVCKAKSIGYGQDKLALSHVQVIDGGKKSCIKHDIAISSAKRRLHHTSLNLSLIAGKF